MSQAERLALYLAAYRERFGRLPRRTPEFDPKGEGE